LNLSLATEAGQEEEESLRVTSEALTMPSIRSGESQTRGLVRPAGPEDSLELI
jgi:hypothetical protein